MAALVKYLCRNLLGPLVPTYLEDMVVLKGTTKVSCNASYSSASDELSADGMRTNEEPCLRLRGMRLT